MNSRLIVRRLTKVSEGAAPQRVMMDAYPDDAYIEWRRIMARVIDGDATLIEIGVKSGVSDYPSRSQKVANAGQSLSVTTPLQGSGDYQLYAIFTGTAVGEMLEMTAFGVRVYET